MPMTQVPPLQRDAFAHAEHAQIGDTRVSCNNQQVVIALGGRELALL